jgi:hypothetical protein
MPKVTRIHDRTREMLSVLSDNRTVDGWFR